MPKKEKNKDENIEKEEKELPTLVVNELPTKELRKVRLEDGKEYELVTVQEAIQEILIKVRTIESAI